MKYTLILISFTFIFVTSRLISSAFKLIKVDGRVRMIATFQLEEGEVIRGAAAGATNGFKSRERSFC
jgi:hypothetical protein